jgi:hypothetical protein
MNGPKGDSEMTSFTLRGHRSGHPKGQEITLTWKDGKLSGDPEAVTFVEALASGYEGMKMGQIRYGFTTHNHLSNPHIAHELMMRAFRGHPILTGNLP